jgi:NAD(P)-dependent dehydrogenase (short-subunit alcohol dehydrogenase family)
MRLQNKVAIVTGGASGIGRVTASLFAHKGARVAVVDVDAEGGQETVEQIENAGGEAFFIAADVSNETEVRNAVASTVVRFGGIDLLFNNAGINEGGGAGGSIEEQTEERWDRVLAVNLKGTILCSKHAVSELRRNGGGAIVNTASISGLVAVSTHAYSASKAAIIQLTRTMARELGPQGIRVNSVAPGAVETPMTVGPRGDVSREERVQMMARLVERTPLGRIGQPEDIAHAALYLASDEASFVTGQVLAVDGGYTAL